MNIIPSVGALVSLLAGILILAHSRKRERRRVSRGLDNLFDRNVIDEASRGAQGVRGALLARRPLVVRPRTQRDDEYSNICLRGAMPTEVSDYQRSVAVSMNALCSARK